MMDHNQTTAEGLAAWIERRAHTPAELRQVLGYALKDAEARGEERGEQRASQEVPATPLNADVGRRMPVAREAGETWQPFPGGAIFTDIGGGYATIEMPTSVNTCPNCRRAVVGLRCNRCKLSFSQSGTLGT